MQLIRQSEKELDVETDFGTRQAVVVLLWRLAGDCRHRSIVLTPKTGQVVDYKADVTILCPRVATLLKER